MSNDVQDQPLLWHYTNEAGLRGVLKEKKLWATDFRFLNDYEEYIHAIRLARDELARRQPQGELDEIFLRHFDESFAFYERAFIGAGTAKAYVFSLSARSDHLAQWRAYARGDLGFSLGFNSQHLPHIDGAGLLQCIYSETEKKRIVSEFIDETHEHFRELTTPPPEHPYHKNSILNMLHGRVIYNFSPIAIRMKNSAFDDENEWRIVLLQRDEQETESMKLEVIHRQVQAGHVPYVEMSLSGYSTWPVQEIMVAPSENRGLAVEAAKRAIRAAGLDSQGIRITESRIPLRTR